MDSMLMENVQGVTVKEIMKRRKEREAAVAAAVKERYAAVKESADTTQAA